MPKFLHFFLLPALTLLAIPTLGFAALSFTASLIWLTVRIAFVYTSVAVSIFSSTVLPFIWKPFYRLDASPASSTQATSIPESPPSANTTPDGTPPSRPLHRNPFRPSRPRIDLVGYNGYRFVDRENPEDDYTWLNFNTRLEFADVPAILPASSDGTSQALIPAPSPSTSTKGKNHAHTPIQLAPGQRLTTEMVDAFSPFSPACAVDYFELRKQPRTESQNNDGTTSRVSGHSDRRSQEPSMPSVGGPSIRSRRVSPASSAEQANSGRRISGSGPSISLRVPESKK